VTPTPRVAIHYRRPPDRLRIYDQRIVAERDDVIVTLSEPLDLDAPMTVDGSVMLEPGSLAVWFTFPGVWHDIGRFYRADGSFSGLYANILTPPVIDGPVWHTTDLYLDVWWPEHGRATLLDEDELDQALADGHIDAPMADRAREEADRILNLVKRGSWPPSIVEEWTLERALGSFESPD
jgi:predicted RNA-binding protein associated with RNAse of E/G family